MSEPTRVLKLTDSGVDGAVYVWVDRIASVSEVVRVSSRYTVVRGAGSTVTVRETPEQILEMVDACVVEVETHAPEERSSWPPGESWRCIFGNHERCPGTLIRGGSTVVPCACACHAEGGKQPASSNVARVLPTTTRPVAEQERASATCPGCGHRVQTVVPRGGDGSVEVYFRHDSTPGERCWESRMEVNREDRDRATAARRAPETQQDEEEA